MESSDSENGEASPKSDSTGVSRWLSAVAAGVLVLVPPVWLIVKGREANQRLGLAPAIAAEPSATSPQDLAEYSRQFALAHTLLSAGKARESLPVLERCKQLRPEVAAVYNNFCVAYGLLERVGEAVAACRRALEIDPGSQLAKNNLARLSGMKPKVAQ
jgi:Flp pilus assembly protein TadD